MLKSFFKELNKYWASLLLINISENSLDSNPYRSCTILALVMIIFLFKSLTTSGIDLFSKSENVIITRTFSKIYGLSSLRVGWGYGSKKIITALNLIKPPFNVNEVAQKAAIEALKQLTHAALQNDKIEATLKCRLGLGRELNYEFFEEFIDEISKTGIKFIYVHARNAILSGISPQGNRTIPPLSYDFVKKIKN